MDDKQEAFMKEYGELVKKHNMDFAPFPSFVPDGEGGFKVITQNIPLDISGQSVKSPFVPES